MKERVVVVATVVSVAAVAVHILAPDGCGNTVVLRSSVLDLTMSPLDTALSCVSRYILARS